MSETSDTPSDLPRAARWLRRPSDSPAARLSALWLHGQPPDLRAFLAGAGRLSAEELTDVLCTDQRERWLRDPKMRCSSDEAAIFSHRQHSAELAGTHLGRCTDMFCALSRSWGGHWAFSYELEAVATKGSNDL